MFLGVDPGKLTGWAVLDAAGELVVCGLGEDFPCLSNRRAVIEYPEISKRTRRPKDIITLAMRVGRYHERLEKAGVRVDLILPATWKGSIDKDRHHPRIDALFTQRERDVFLRGTARLAAGPKENVYDAVGLVKWAWGAGKFT